MIEFPLNFFNLDEGSGKQFLFNNGFVDGNNILIFSIMQFLKTLSKANSWFLN